MRCLGKFYGFSCGLICESCEIGQVICVAFCLSVMIPWPSVLKVKRVLKSETGVDNTRDF